MIVCRYTHENRQPQPNGHVSQVHYHCQGCRNECMTVKGCFYRLLQSVLSQKLFVLLFPPNLLSHSLTHDQRFESAIDFALHPSPMYVKQELNTKEHLKWKAKSSRGDDSKLVFLCTLSHLFIAKKTLEQRSVVYQCCLLLKSLIVSSLTISHRTRLKIV